MYPEVEFLIKRANSKEHPLDMNVCGDFSMIFVELMVTTAFLHFISWAYKNIIMCTGNM